MSYGRDSYLQQVKLAGLSTCWQEFTRNLAVVDSCTI